MEMVKCGSNTFMDGVDIRRIISTERRFRTAALAGVCLLAGLSVIGPSGLLAWGENLRLRDDRAARLAILQEKREHLKHRVELLSPDNADPDLVSELIRQNLDVVHPDEKVIILDKPAQQGE